MTRSPCIQATWITHCRQHPHAFAAEVFPELHGIDLCDEPYVFILAEIVRGRSKHPLQIINAPASSLISWMATAMLAGFHLGRDPTSTIEIVFGDPRALALGTLQTRQLLAATNYSKIFPSLRLLPTEQASSELRTAQGGRIAFRTIHEAGSGPSADLLVFETPQFERDVSCQATRDHSFNLFQKAVRRLAPRGSMLLSTPRLHRDDLSGRLTAGGNYISWPLPLIAEHPMEYNFGKHGVKRPPGNVLDSTMWTSAEIEHLKRELPAATFAAHFQQTPL